MALTLSRDHTTTLAQDAALTKCLGKGILSTVKDSTNYTEGFSGVIVIAASATDVEIPMQGVTTGTFLRLEGTAEFSYKLSGVGNTATTVKLPSAAIPAVTEGTMQFTSLHITNPAATAFTLSYIVAGV